MLQNQPDKKDRDRDYEGYGLKGIKTSVDAKDEQRCLCPECESTRTHKGHKDCEVNVDYGVWHCHHCGASGYVPSRKEIEDRSSKERRIERLRSATPDPKKYSRPKWVPEFVVGNLFTPHRDQQMIIDYLCDTRKLSREVLTRARVSIPWVDQWMTFETGRYMVVTGRPGDGKSEFVDELCLRLCLLHEWRIAYFSPENVPLKYHLAKLISKLTGYEFKHLGTRGQVHLHYDVLTGRYVPCTVQKLSEQDFILLQGQSLKPGEQLLTVGTSRYLKCIDWRGFNLRWIDEQGQTTIH